MTRKLSREQAEAALAAAVPLTEDLGSRRASRTLLHGSTPAGDQTQVELRSASLVVFASTTCDGCRDLAALVADGIAGFEVLGCVRAPSSGLPASELTAFTAAGGHWLVGDDAFDALDVRDAPFFCVLDEQGTVVVEGVAFGRAHLEGHCARVARGEPLPEVIRLDPEAP